MLPGELSSPAKEEFLFRCELSVVPCLTVLAGLARLLPPPRNPLPATAPAAAATLNAVLFVARCLVLVRGPSICSVNESVGIGEMFEASPRGRSACGA